MGGVQAPSSDSHTSGYNSSSVGSSFSSSRSPGAGSPNDSQSVSTLGDSSIDDTSMEVTTEELELDIDNKLAEIMSGVHSLELQQQVESIPLEKPPRGGGIDKNRKDGAVYAGVANPKRTPDLVLDLPRETEMMPSPRELTYPLPMVGQQEDSPTLTTAEVFAKSNQCTIKKGTTLSMPKKVTHHTATNNGTAVAMTAHEQDGDISSMKRSTSSNTDMSTRQKSTSLPRGPERYSDPASHSSGSLASNTTKKASTLPASARSLAPDRPATPERGRSLTPDRPITPDESANLEDSAYSTLPRSDKPKPPLRTKPSVARKPAKSPEILKRIKEAQEANRGGQPP